MNTLLERAEQCLKELGIYTERTPTGTLAVSLAGIQTFGGSTDDFLAELKTMCDTKKLFWDSEGVFNTYQAMFLASF